MTSNEEETFPATGIKVIIVGAGFAGLSLAIECVRNGHEVEIFESAKKFSPLGDLIGITPNATRVLSKWGSVLSDVRKKCTWSDKMLIHTSDGTLIHTQPMILFNDVFPFCNTHRANFQHAFYVYAVSQGVKVRFGERITEFFQTDDGAGIISNGNRIIADLVVGADGVHSKARNFVTGTIDKPVSSGFAIYRAWFPLDILSNNPMTENYVHGGDSMNAWIGADVHCFVTVNKSLDSVSYVLTHKDDYTVEESWSFPGRVEDILKVVEGWDPVLLAILAATPSDRLIDWKLLWRDPLKKWVSQKGRVALSGDAAHPFLPSSGNGASQAIEDSATIATALRLAGKQNVKLALKAYETLRYERVCLSQRNGFETRHRWHKTNWKAFAEDPDSINLPQPDWLYGHDAEKYTIERWDDVVAHLTKGTAFVSTNTPEGHVHKDWSIAEVMEAEKHTASPADAKIWRNGTAAAKAEKGYSLAIHVESLSLADAE